MKNGTAKLYFIGLLASIFYSKALAFASPCSPVYLVATLIRRGTLSASHDPPRPAPLSPLRTTTSPLVPTSLNAIKLIPRGGEASADSLATTLQDIQDLVNKPAFWNSSPVALFNTSLFALVSLTVLIQSAHRIFSPRPDPASKDKRHRRPASIKDLQRRFLLVFWLIRCADWLQGPYFYEVYATKHFGGKKASMALVSRLFLTGFASTAFFGPWVGKAIDIYGRKRGTLAFALLYSLGALSTKSDRLAVLILGRVLSGIGTSLLFSAPEAWLVGQAHQTGDDPEGNWLGETFGYAYTGDSIVAILAGQMAGTAANRRGPTGPFDLSTVFLGLGAMLVSLFWKENVALSSDSAEDDPVDAEDLPPTKRGPSITYALRAALQDQKIMLVGGVQSLFEAAIYIFVLQWPPAVSLAISNHFGVGVPTPYGTVFACFMACCLLGATTFRHVSKRDIPTERSTSLLLALATAAMASATYNVSRISNSLATVSPMKNLAVLIGAFFAFEVAVGMYFPSIGTLRGKYVPDRSRSVIMNLFGIPLNVLVVGVFLSSSKLGLQGSLGIATGALGMATMCMWRLSQLAGIGKRKAKKNVG
eukprot:Nitzschia sp. Nitz4//scaffold48_size128905//24678//26513//NITZ4_003583-RA/size128905-augustus-gene-0.19-mRNA-1//-1//CDS//3329552931//5782//frame0